MDETKEPDQWPNGSGWFRPGTCVVPMGTREEDVKGFMGRTVRAKDNSGWHAWRWIGGVVKTYRYIGKFDHPHLATPRM